MKNRGFEEMKMDHDIIQEYMEKNNVKYKQAIVDLLKENKITPLNKETHFHSFRNYPHIEEKESNRRKSKHQDIGRLDHEPTFSFEHHQRILNKKYRAVLKVQIIWLYDSIEQQGACAKITLLKSKIIKPLKAESNSELFDKIENLYNEVKEK